MECTSYFLRNGVHLVFLAEWSLWLGIIVVVVVESADGKLAEWVPSAKMFGLFRGQPARTRCSLHYASSVGRGLPRLDDE